MRNCSPYPPYESYALRPRRCRHCERVCGGSPFAGGFLAAEHETGGVSAGEPGEESCEVLAAPSLRIGHGLHGLGDPRSKKVSRRAAPGVASSALIPPAA